jgi:hypothetical protein
LETIFAMEINKVYAYIINVCHVVYKKAVLKIVNAHLIIVLMDAVILYKEKILNIKSIKGGF